MPRCFIATFNVSQLILSITNVCVREPFTNLFYDRTVVRETKNLQPIY